MLFAITQLIYSITNKSHEISLLPMFHYMSKAIQEQLC